MKPTCNRIFILLGTAGLLVLPVSCTTKGPAPQTFGGATPLQWSVRLADSEIARRADSLAWKQGGTAKWDYTAGLFTLSLLKLNEGAPHPDYVEFAEQAIGSFIATDGSIQGYKVSEYQLDALNPGKTVLALWQLTQDGRYQKAAALLRKQLDTQPRTGNGGFWHKQRYTNQMWLDGLYMGGPFYAEYARLFNGPVSDYDDVANQIQQVAAHTYDPVTGLFYHAWDESRQQPWANKDTGTSSNFWGRAVGWYAMALVDVLDYFPTNHPARQEIIATFQKLCGGVVKYQDPKTGLWYQVLDQGDRQGNYLEATASGMFVYAMAKGMNRGYLPREYVPVVEKGYRGIIENLVKNDGNGKWSLTQFCSVAGLGGAPSNGRVRDGSFNYYINEPVVSNDLKGVGPFILAGIELQHLLSGPTVTDRAAAKGLKPVTVKVANPSSFRRADETVEINLQTVAADLHLNAATGKFAVKDCATGKVLDSQVYASEPGQVPDKLLFQVDLGSRETRTFCIVEAATLAQVPVPTVKTFARYVPERMDDFAWESDRIAHRTYGQALIKGEGTITSGPDVWIKKNRGLIVDMMYATKHYHADNGEELDNYRVGKSRGCGGVGIWDGQKLYNSSNYRNWRLITSGPIRSEFELTYDAWDAGNGRKVSETKRYSIDAGSWFTKARSTFASEGRSPLTIGVGLAERACGPDGEELIAQDQAEGWMTYWQPEDKPKGIIGVAMILPKGSVEAFTNDVPEMPEAALHAAVPQPTHEGFPAIRNLLAITQVKVGRPFTYYFGACWDRSGDFTNRFQWEDYVRQLAERRDAPLQVTISN